jgi:hypothetical protein
MEVVEVFPCENKRDLCIREQEYIGNAKNKINSKSAYVSEEERKVCANKCNKQYQIANKDELKKYQKQFYLENKDKIREQQQQYRLNNRDKILEYQLANKERISERMRLYYVKKKNEIK